MLNEQFVVVGCGSIGRRHLGNLLRLGVRGAAGVDPSSEQRKRVEAEFGVPTFRDLASALKDGADAALICSPSSLHLEHAIEAAQARCHLFIEKPVAISLDGVDALLKEAAKHRLATLVGCNFRFTPGLRKAKQLLDEGSIGRVVSIRATFGQYLPEWHPLEDYRRGYSAQKLLGGGVILDRIHEIDYVRWLGGEIKDVCALAGHLSNLEIDTEDTAEILLRFEGGALGAVHLDYVRREYDCSVEITGTDGIIQWSYRPQRVRWYSAAESCWDTHEWSRYDGNEMYIEEMKHFLRVLDRKQEAELGVAEGVRVLRIALAVQQSAAERKVLSV